MLPPAEQRRKISDFSCQADELQQSKELAPIRDKIADLASQIESIKKASPRASCRSRQRRAPSGSLPEATGRMTRRNRRAGDSGGLARSSNYGPKMARLDFARWMVAADNPLVSRVFVNRLWRLFFGQGIVRTLADFGTQGSGRRTPNCSTGWPSNCAKGWDVKRLIKQMVMSRTYQQSRRRTPSCGNGIRTTTGWRGRRRFAWTRSSCATPRWRSAVC